MLVRDPVCESEIDLAIAAASEDHDGWAYFFCSERCHGRFLASPDRFAQKPAESWSPAVSEMSGKGTAI